MHCKDPLLLGKLVLQVYKVDPYHLCIVKIHFCLVSLSCRYTRWMCIVKIIKSVILLILVHNRHFTSCHLKPWPNYTSILYLVLSLPVSPTSNCYKSCASLSPLYSAALGLSFKKKRKKRNKIVSL